MRLLLVSLLLSSGLTQAADTISPASDTRAPEHGLAGYQGWSDPAVRDWRESNRLAEGGHSTPDSAHDNSDMPPPANGAADPAPTPHDGMTMPGMHHGAM